MHLVYTSVDHFPVKICLQSYTYSSMSIVQAKIIINNVAINNWNCLEKLIVNFCGTIACEEKSS